MTARRKLRPLLVAALIAAAGAARADEFSDAVAALRASVERHSGSGAPSVGGSAVSDRISTIERAISELDRTARDLSDRKSDIESKESHAHTCKVFWESAQREADRVSRAHDDRLVEWRGRWDSNEAAIVRHNAEPHEFKLPDENAALVAYDNAAAVLRDRQTRLETEKAELLARGAREILAAQTEAGGKAREYWDAQAKADSARMEFDTMAAGFREAVHQAAIDAQDLEDTLAELSRPVFGGGSLEPAYAPRHSEAEAMAAPVEEREGEPVRIPPALRGRAFTIRPQREEDGGGGRRDALRELVIVEKAAQELRNYAPVVVGDEPAPQPFDTGLRAPGGFDVGPAPGADAVVVAAPAAADARRWKDPDSFYTAQDYRAARQEIARIEAVTGKLRAKIDELHKWRDGTHEQAAEFEKARDDAVRGEVSDVLGAVPMGMIAGRAVKAGQLAPQAAKRLELAWEAVKALQAARDADDAKEIHDRTTAAISALDGAAGIAVELKLAGIDPKNVAAVEWMEHTGKALKVSSKLLAFGVSVDKDATGPEHKSDRERKADAAMLGLEVGGVFCPPLEFGLGLYKVGSREGEKYLADQALESLQGALDGNARADMLLEIKIEALQREAARQRRIVEAYESRGTPDAHSIR